MSLIKSFKKTLGLETKKAESTDIVSVPKTVQESIPYIAVNQNGIIQISPRMYSRMYTLGELNFANANTEEQKQIFVNYMEFLGSFGPEVKIQVFGYNKTISRAEFERKILLPMQSDSLNEYRVEINDMLIDKMATARNNIIQEKYIVLTTEADDIETAINVFNRLDSEMAKGGQRACGVESKPLTAEQRLGILYEIYNQDSDSPFIKRMFHKGRQYSTFSFRDMLKAGLTTRDLIGPPYMEFNSNYFKLGETFGRVLMLRELPSYLRADVFAELSRMPFNMLTSIQYRSLPQSEAIKKIKYRQVDINANVVDRQKKASRNGYSPDLISPEIKQASAEVGGLMSDLTSENQKLFMTTITMTVFAKSMEELDKYTKVLQATAERFICEAKILGGQQEQGLNTSLPLGKNCLSIERMLTTRAAATFLPFSVKELMQPGGIYYGQNAVSKQLILYNRLSANNGNGCILGKPGSGKSFKAKEELIFGLLNFPDDDFIVIDPESEFKALAEMFYGTVIRIAPGSDVHINPMDLDIAYADEDDPLTLKADFIASICEAASSSRYPLSPGQKSIIDRCVLNVYDNYVKVLRSEGRNFDSELVPTLIDLYNELKGQDEPEARNLSLALERFTTGTQNVFAHKTNIDVENRFLVYDVKDIGEGLKSLGLQIALDNIWNRMIANFRKGKRTWLYVDEFHILVETPTAARYTRQIWKRARKWNGIPTGITQQLEDMLKSEEARAIINTSDFVVMLDLDSFGRSQLQQMFEISDTEMEYVTSSASGQGLIYNGTDIIPFVDNFPKDTKLYKAMTTKPNEVAGNR